MRVLPALVGLVDGEAHVGARPRDDDLVPFEVVEAESGGRAQLALARAEVDADLEGRISHEKISMSDA